MLTLDGVDVLDVREAAKYVGRTPETVRRWVWSGRVSAIRQGHRLFIPRTDLDDSVLSRPEEQLSLAEWAASVPRAESARATSASSLVLEDRRDDHRR